MSENQAELQCRRCADCWVSPRWATEDAQLSEHIQAIHQMSDGTYAAPQARAELVGTHGLQVGLRRVARLMGEAMLTGIRWGCTACDEAG